MSVLLRARISSFLAGVAVAGLAGIVQLRNDLLEGQEAITKQVASQSIELEKRVAALEALAAAPTL